MPSPSCGAEALAGSKPCALLVGGTGMSKPKTISEGSEEENRMIDDAEAEQIVGGADPEAPDGRAPDGTPWSPRHSGGGE